MQIAGKTDSMTLDDLQGEYDARADGYEQKLWLDQYILGVAHRRKQLMSKARGKILDIACGTGLNFPFFPTTGDISAIDLSPRMLEVARQKAESLKIKIQTLVMDAEKLEFTDGSFDTVSSALSTCTFPDPIRALREMRRVCRPRRLDPAPRTRPQQYVLARKLPGSSRDPALSSQRGLPLESRSAGFDPGSWLENC